MEAVHIPLGNKDIYTKIVTNDEYMGLRKCVGGIGFLAPNTDMKRTDDFTLLAEISFASTKSIDNLIKLLNEMKGTINEKG